MSSQARAIVLFLTIVAVMLVSAVGTTSAYADDGTPPPPPTEETSVVDPSTSEAAATTEPTEVAPSATEEPVATEAAATEAPVVATPAATEAPVVEEQQPVEPAAEATSILEQVPDNTTVTVLNAEGEAQPLTSQESANAIATASDPVWCPYGVSPGDASCTQSFSSFTALLTFLKQKEDEGDVNYMKRGTIFVEMGSYAGPETSIDFNTYNFVTFAQKDLVIQGGWNTTTNTTTDTSQFNIPIVIGTSTNPWAGSLTINNIGISNVVNQTGLTLYSNKDVKLSNVTVTGSLAGADLNAKRDVVVKDSKFNGNKQFGATITAGRLADIRNSEFNKNTDNSQNDGFGLKVNSQGDVSLDTVYANYNEEFGADITSVGSISISNSIFSGNVAYTTECKWQAKQGCHEICVKVANGGGYGLKAVSTSPDNYAVYLDGVTAENNYLFGAHIEALDAEIHNSSFNLNGSGELDDPKGYGLEVLTTGGTGVTLDKVHADNNQLFGANITAGTQTVTISNSFFNGNKSYYVSCSYQAKQSCHEVCVTTYSGYGLQVVSTGTILLSQVSANKNYLYGAHLSGSYVSIAGGLNQDGTFNPSTFDENGVPGSTTAIGQGLKIESTTGVSLSIVSASYNQEFGANINAQGSVVIYAGFFNGHKIYKYSGNCTDADKAKKSCYDEPCVKTLIGGGYGLEVVTTGDIFLTGVEANDNYLFGAHLVGNSVSISGFPQPDGSTKHSSFKKNKEGLKIESQGSVTLNYVDASNNSVAGATILSGLNTNANGTVLINNSFFSGNASYTSSYCKGKTYYGYGLKVVTTGDFIGLNNVVANNNNLYGAHLEGSGISIVGDITTDSNGNPVFGTSFSNNGTGNRGDHIGFGLEVVNTGTNSVTLNGVRADGNQLFGANIQADGGYVSITNGSFSGNYSYYKNCSGKGSSGGSSSGGSSHSGSSSGSSGKSCQNCTKTYDGYGINVVTTNDINMQNVTADKNYLYGAHLDGNNVTVSNSTFSFNASPVVSGQTPTGRGLEVKSAGNTSLNGVEANHNQLFGATIEAGGQVSVIDSTFSDNKYYTSTTCKNKKSAGYGLKVVSIATTVDPNFAAAGITLSGVEASNNGAEGAILNGQSTVQVTDSLFNNNGASGLDVTATGDITLTDITADKNKVDGVDVKGVCTNTVYVNDGTFTRNSKYGIKVTGATYSPSGTQTFGGNGSGNVFQNSSTCVSSGSNANGGGTGSGNAGGGNSGHGWNSWYWWWFWLHH